MLENIWELDFVRDGKEVMIGWGSFTPRIQGRTKETYSQNAFRRLWETESEGFTGYGLSITVLRLCQWFPLDDL